jgi:hypothetical protein
MPPSLSKAKAGRQKNPTEPGLEGTLFQREHGPYGPGHSKMRDFAAPVTGFFGSSTKRPGGAQLSLTGPTAEFTFEPTGALRRSPRPNGNSSIDSHVDGITTLERGGLEFEV